MKQFYIFLLMVIPLVSFSQNRLDIIGAWESTWYDSPTNTENKYSQYFIWVAYSNGEWYQYWDFRYDGKSYLKYETQGVWKLEESENGVKHLIEDSEDCKHTYPKNRNRCEEPNWEGIGRSKILNFSKTGDTMTLKYIDGSIGTWQRLKTL